MHKRLVFFEFEELIVALALIGKPYRRHKGRRALELLFNRCISQKLRRAAQIVVQLQHFLFNDMCL